MNRENLQNLIAGSDLTKNFQEVALSTFRYQAYHNPLYGRFLELLAVDPDRINNLKQIPYLPISLFKTHEIKTGNWSSPIIFTSSGTTGQVTSKHHLRNKKWYRQNSLRAFEQFYGPVKDFCIFGLLPSYLERSGSSLVFMVQEFIKESKYPQSGFFLNHQDALEEHLIICQKEKIPTLLIGVSFALLDFAESTSIDLRNCVVMETGGMKGRRKEMTRPELHKILCEAFQTKYIHSEYGMTELLSQSYSKGNGLFYPSQTKKILCREITDPFHIVSPGKTGVLNVIDLANLDTCSFIATDDLGRVYEDGSFEVLGRLDGSELRGCSLMVF
ncbi:MAG: acyl transferase [Saprospiraceae bacterium]